VRRTASRPAMRTSRFRAAEGSCVNRPGRSSSTALSLSFIARHVSLTETYLFDDRSGGTARSHEVVILPEIVDELAKDGSRRRVVLGFVIHVCRTLAEIVLRVRHDHELVPCELRGVASCAIALNALSES
jgi:hypothetical protein